GGVLDDLEKRGNNLIGRASKRGDMVVAHAGSELQLAIANARVMLDEQRQKTIADLTNLQRSTLAALHAELETVERMFKEGGEVRSLTALRMIEARETVERLREAFRVERAYFHIASVQNLSLAFDDGRHEVEIIGMGIGYPGQEPHTQVDVLLDGKELPFTNVRRPENNRLKVLIPVAALKSRFADSEVVRVPLTVRSRITPKGGKELTYELTLPLLLLPKNAGTFELRETVTRKGW